MATCLLADDRGMFVLIKLKPLEAVKFVGIALSDLNTDRLYKILGKFGIPLLTVQARTACAEKLQSEVEALIAKGEIKPVAGAKYDHLEPPLL
jgi:hypothetical protein